MQCEVKGLTFFHGDDGRHGFVVVALATVDFPELRMQLEGVRLTHSDKGWRALPPFARIRGSSNAAMYWRSGSPLADAACKMMLAMYEKMGGSKPEAAANNAAAKRRIAERKAKPDAIDTALEAVDAELAANPGKSLSEASADVWADFKAAAFAECDRAVENAKRKGKPVPVRSVEQIDAQMSDAPDISEMGLSRPETAGLARTLGVA